MITHSVPIETAIDMAKTIPCAPAILPKLLKLMESDIVEASDIERLILADPGLATAVLRLANSAYFSRSRKCEDISEAMLRLGSITLYHLAATSAAGRWLNHPVQGYGWETGDLARHSLCVAVAAEVLAERSRVCKPETAYTAGLIHDVGKLAMAYANMNALEEVEQELPDRKSSWREIEHELLGYDFTDVSRLLLKNWGFPPSLVAVGALHPRPALAAPEDRPLVTLIHASKHIALQLGFGVGSDGFRSELDERSLIESGFDDEILDTELPNILEKIERYIDTDGRLKQIH